MHLIKVKLQKTICLVHLKQKSLTRDERKHSLCISIDEDVIKFTSNDLLNADIHSYLFKFKC